MALLVQKFGGTSVGTTERIEAVADKVCQFRKDGHDIVVVVSAMSGETNRLIALANDIMEEPTPREMDVLVSTGEQVRSEEHSLNSSHVRISSYTLSLHDALPILVVHPSGQPNGLKRSLTRCVSSAKTVTTLWWWSPL